MIRLTREWVKKAETDFVAAERLNRLEVDGPGADRFASHRIRSTWRCCDRLREGCRNDSASRLMAEGVATVRRSSAAVSGSATRNESPQSLQRASSSRSSKLVTSRRATTAGGRTRQLNLGCRRDRRSAAPRGGPQGCLPKRTTPRQPLQSVSENCSQTTESCPCGAWQQQQYREPDSSTLRPVSAPATCQHTERSPSWS